NPFILAITVASIFGCQNISDVNRPVSNEPLDTIQETKVDVSASPSLYETAFLKKSSIRDSGDAKIRFFGITSGQLKIPSGKVIICDPLHIDEYGIPFTENFPTGDFPVQLSILMAGKEESVAFARIKFNDSPVVTWKQALRE